MSCFQLFFDTFYVNNHEFCWTFCPLEVVFAPDSSACIKMVVLAVS